MPRADWNVLKKYSLPKPSDGLLAVFNDTVRPITAQCLLADISAGDSRNGYRLCGDVRTCPRPVFDNDLLTEPLRQPLPQNPRYSVSTATGRIPNDPSHWPRRIGLRASETGDGRQCRGHRGQMQEYAAGKFHFEPPSPFRSFDHLVGGHQQLVWHTEPEHSGGLVVDDQLEFGRLYHRQVRGLCALENVTCISAHVAKGIHQARSVAHQPASFGGLPHWIYRGDPVECRQLGQLDAAAVEEGARADGESVRSLAHKTCERCVDLGAAAGLKGSNLHAHGPSSCLGVLQRGGCSRSVGRIDEHGNTSNPRH